MIASPREPPVRSAGSLARPAFWQREGDAMAISHEEVMEDLAYAEAEGPADMLEDEADFADMSEDYGEEDAWDRADMGDFYEEDGMESEEAEESVGQVLGNILGAEEEDEFLGKLFQG